MDLYETLAELCDISAPSGFEAPLAERAVTLLRPYMDEAYIDPFGNAIGVRRCGKEGAKRLLLDAHLDEIGLLVTGITEGFLRFATIGGVDTRILPNTSVCILTPDETRFGVITSQPPHLQTATSQNEAMTLDDLWIDCGLSQAEAEASIPLGTPVVFDSPLWVLQEDIWTGKALDDRAGFVTLLSVAEQLKDEALNLDLYIMGSTREEVGLRGAMVGTFAIHPDLCVAVDVTHGKTTDASKEESFPLGAGAIIGLGVNCNRPMTHMLLGLAEEMNLPADLEIMGGNSGTNAWQMQIAREGVATALISLPLRYMHTPNEVINAQDIRTSARLLSAFVRRLEA